MTLSDDQFRNLVVGGEVALGGALAYVDRAWAGNRVFAVWLVLIALAGYAATAVSPFNFADGGYFMQGVIAVYGAVTALAGYAVAAIGLWLCAIISGARTS